MSRDVVLIVLLVVLSHVKGKLWGGGTYGAWDVPWVMACLVEG